MALNVTIGRLWIAVCVSVGGEPFVHSCAIKRSGDDGIEEGHGFSVWLPWIDREFGLGRTLVIGLWPKPGTEKGGACPR